DPPEPGHGTRRRPHHGGNPPTRRRAGARIGGRIDEPAGTAPPTAAARPRGHGDRRRRGAVPGGPAAVDQPAPDARRHDRAASRSTGKPLIRHPGSAKSKTPATGRSFRIAGGKTKRTRPN